MWLYERLPVWGNMVPHTNPLQNNRTFSLKGCLGMPHAESSFLSFSCGHVASSPSSRTHFSLFLVLTKWNTAIYPGYSLVSQPDGSRSQEHDFPPAVTGAQRRLTLQLQPLQEPSRARLMTVHTSLLHFSVTHWGHSCFHTIIPAHGLAAGKKCKW